jgi:Tfp pilus assembly protein PilF
MKTGYIILSAASIIPLLSGCASNQKAADSEAWSVKPIFSVRNSTETPDAYYQLGRYYQGQNRYDQALVAYQKSLDIDGKFADARNGLGVIYSMQGKLSKALEQFRLAVELAPNASHIFNNLGYALYLNGLYDDAANALERAVALNPSNQATQANLALALSKAGVREKTAPTNQVAQLVRAETSAPAPVVTTPMPAPSPVLQQALELPKNGGVITQAARQPVPLAESSIQAVQIKPNVYELRERVEVQVQVAPAAKPHQQASIQPKEQPVIAAQAAQKPVPSITKQQAQAVAPAAKPYRIEVSNGNGVTGMAKKVAGFLNGEGYSGARLTNQKPFQVTSSQVQYRAGYREQAQSLISTLPGKPGIAQADDLRRDISIRVVLGKDMAGNVAHFEPSQDKTRLARHGSDS